MDSYKKLVLLYHTLGSSQYQTVKTVSKSVEEIVADFKEAYTEAEAIIESYDVMRQQNMEIATAVHVTAPWRQNGSRTTAGSCGIDAANEHSDKI